MAKINLLPWREELRKQRQQDFVIAIMIGVLITGCLFLMVYFHIEGLKSYQERRNTLIESEIKIVDKKIKKIKDIESKKDQLLTKIDVIQTLQESRPEIVHLFTELATSTPEGIYLTQFKQAGHTLTLTGKAESNARVSAFMRAIDRSEWLELPVLEVISDKGMDKKTGGRLSDFSMQVKQKTRKDKTQEDK